MSEATNRSEVARLRQQITMEFEAAQRGLSGLASGTAQHKFIIARMERMADHHQTLKRLVGDQEAIQILAQALEEASGNEGKDVC